MLAPTDPHADAAPLAAARSAGTLAHADAAAGSRAVAHYLGAQLAPGVSRAASAGRLDLAALVLTLRMTDAAADGAAIVNAARDALDALRAGALTEPRRRPGIAPTLDDAARVAVVRARAALGAAPSDHAPVMADPGDIARAFPWGSVTAADTLTMGAALASVYAPATVGAILSAVRSVLRLAVAFGEAPDGQANAAAAISRPRDGRTDPTPRRSTAHAGDPSTLTALWRAIDADPAPVRRARDAALLALLYGAGLRRAEAAALRVADAQLEIGAASVTVRRGKGGRTRTVPLAPWAAGLIADWRRVRRDALPDDAADGALLLSVGRHGAPLASGLSGHAIGRIVGRLAGDAAVPVVPHDLRRAFVSAAITEGGGDLSGAAYLAGHASVTTTARYDRRQERAAAAIAAAIPAPWPTVR